MSNDLEVLKAARQLIDKQSHIPRWKFLDVHNCYCLMGAIGIYHNPNQGYILFDNDGDRFARYLGFKKEADAFEYNDSYTKEEIIKLMDTAIKKLENEND